MNRRERIAFRVAIATMIIGMCMIGWSLYASAWSGDLLAYVLGGILFAGFVVAQTLYAAAGDRVHHRRRRN